MESKILIVEDKPLLAEDLKDRLETLGYSNIIGPFSSGEESLKAVEKNFPDIAILDINLAGSMDGIDVAKSLNRTNRTSIIYLTHLEDQGTLQRCMDTFPVAFLNKPFTNSEFRIALQNAENQRASKIGIEHDSWDMLEDRIFIRNGKGKILVKLEDILWIQSGGGETSAITVGKRYSQGKLPYTVGFNLNKLEERLSFCNYLIRSSRFHIVNLRKVERIFNDPKSNKNKKILQIGDEEFPVGDKFRKNVMDKLHFI